MNKLDWNMILQAIGYFSTLLVLISFLMTSVVKLRLVNLVGSGIFVVFALLTKSYPTAIMNLGICAINIYFLIRLWRSEKLTTMLPIETDNAYLKEFLGMYKEDIGKWFPAFDAADPKADTAYFVYYDMNPVGLIMGNKTQDGAFRICLDYTTPKYRDSSVGRFLYPKLLEEYTALEFKNIGEKHEKYLKKTDFVKQGDLYRLERKG